MEPFMSLPSPFLLLQSALLLLTIFVRICHPSVVAAIRFIDKGTGKKMSVIVGDRMVTLKGEGKFKNFMHEWGRQENAGEISGFELDERLHLLTSGHKFALTPNEAKSGASGTPPKMQLAGSDRSPIAVGFTGSGNTLRNFASKLEQRDRKWYHKLVKYNTLRSVANRLDRSYRQEGQMDNLEGGDLPSQVHYMVKGGNIYAVDIGRTKLDRRGLKVAAKPEIRKMGGNVYTAGADQEAAKHLASIYGTHNLDNGKGKGPRPKLQEKTVEEVFADLQAAFRKNAQSQLDGKISVSENFGSYFIGSHGKAQFREHEPKLEKRVEDLLNKRVPPKELLKRIIDHDDAFPDVRRPGGFQLTQMQKGLMGDAVAEVAEHREKYDRNWDHLDQLTAENEPSIRAFKQGKMQKLKRFMSFTSSSRGSPSNASNNSGDGDDDENQPLLSRGAKVRKTFAGRLSKRFGRRNKGASSRKALRTKAPDIGPTGPRGG